jgi:tetratricopeptide (TPR) repeat protein
MGTEKDRVTDDLQKFIKKSQWDKAIQALARLAEMEPQNAAHRLRSGDYCLKLGATQKAVTAYRQAADLFAEGGFVVKALAAYKMVLRLDPQNENAHEKMQGLHGQAQQQAALSQRYTVTAERSPAMDRQPSAPPEAAVHSVREDEPEALDEGLIGVQPFNLEEFGTGSSPARAASVPLPESEAETAAAAPSVDPDWGGFVIERTAYAGGQASEPAPAPSPQGRRTTDVIPLFSSLTPDEFSEVVERMIPLQVPSGYRIVKEGDAGNSVYLISQGAVRVLTRIGNREVALSELKENDFFGEVGFLTGRPRTASVITQTDTEVLELRGEDLKAIIQKFPRVREVLEGFYKARVKDALSKIKHTGP